MQLGNSEPLQPHRASAAPVPHGAEIRLGQARLDASTGDLIGLGDAPIHGPRLTLWRAPTANDSLPAASYDEAEADTTRGRGTLLASSEQRWRDRGLDRLQRRVMSVALEADAVRVRHRYAPAASTQAVVVEHVWRWVGDELRLEADAQPTAEWTGTWPRIGLAFRLPPGLATAQWYGTGPHENYPDSRQAARVGRFESAIEDLVVDYAVPQESGHRADLRELWLPEAGLRILTEDVAGTRPGFTLRAHDEFEVTGARHPHELPPSTATHLTFDAAQRGLGSASCGPDVRPDYILRPQAAQWTLRILPENPTTG